MLPATLSTTATRQRRGGAGGSATQTAVHTGSPAGGRHGGDGLTPSASVEASASESFAISDSVSTSSEVNSTTLSRSLTALHSVTPYDAHVGNAAEEDGGIITGGLLEAAMAAGNGERVPISRLSTNACRRLEGFAARVALLSPILMDEASATAADALIAALACFVAAVAVGALTLLIAVCFAAPAGSTVGDRFVAAALAVRFPATAIQTFVFLSSGAAVATGVALGGAQGGAPMEAFVGLAVLIVVPLALFAAAQLALPARGRTIAVYEDVADDDDEDGLRRIADKAPTSGFELICAAVRPSLGSKLLGPMVADLRIAPRLLSPLFPFMLPLCLLVSSVVLSAVAHCEAIPVAAGAIYVAYAAAVAVLCPFLGKTHNIVEVTASAMAGVCLVMAGLALGGVTDGSFGAPEAWALCATAISNSRYAFVIARLLDVVLPRVVSVSYKGKRPRDATEAGNARDEAKRVRRLSSLDSLSDVDEEASAKVGTSSLHSREGLYEEAMMSLGAGAGDEDGIVFPEEAEEVDDDVEANFSNLEGSTSSIELSTDVGPDEGVARMGSAPNNSFGLNMRASEPRAWAPSESSASSHRTGFADEDSASASVRSIASSDLSSSSSSSLASLGNRYYGGCAVPSAGAGSTESLNSADSTDSHSDEGSHF